MARTRRFVYLVVLGLMLTACDAGVDTTGTGQESQLVVDDGYVYEPNAVHIDTAGNGHEGEETEYETSFDEQLLNDPVETSVEDTPSLEEEPPVVFTPITLTYKGQDITNVFNVPFRDVLGEPLHEGEIQGAPAFFYDGFYVLIWSSNTDANQTFSISTGFHGYGLSYFGINGVSVAGMTRREVREIFDPKIEYYRRCEEFFVWDVPEGSGWSGMADNCDRHHWHVGYFVSLDGFEILLALHFRPIESKDAPQFLVPENEDDIYFLEHSVFAPQAKS